MDSRSNLDFSETPSTADTPAQLAEDVGVTDEEFSAESGFGTGDDAGGPMVCRVPPD